MTLAEDNTRLVTENTVLATRIAELEQRANVQGSYLHQFSGPTLRLDSAAWIAWLKEANTTSFMYGLHDRKRGYIVGWITVRKEQRERGSSYWVA